LVGIRGKTCLVAAVPGKWRVPNNYFAGTARHSQGLLLFDWLTSKVNVQILAAM